MAEDRKILMDPKKPASFTNPHVKRAVSMLSANPNGEKLLTLASVGRREVYDIREWSTDRTRADKYGVQINKDEVEDFAYALLPFVTDSDLISVAKKRNLSFDENKTVDLGIEGLTPEVLTEAPVETPAAQVQVATPAVLNKNASMQEVEDFFASATLEQLKLEVARREFEAARK